MIAATSLFKTYKGERLGEPWRVDAVCDVDLNIRPGEFVAIVGRSGSGKSSLLGMLSGLSRPSSGAVRFDDADLWSRSADELADFRGRRIGVVFQFASLLPTLRAIDNVALPALMGGAAHWDAAYARTAELLSRVGLESRAGAFPGELSGGEQRRVALARALMRSPEIVFADEPTADLDEATEDEVLNLLLDLQRSDGFALLVVTHSTHVAERADRVLEMRGGRLFDARERFSTDHVCARQARTRNERSISGNTAVAEVETSTESPADWHPTRLATLEASPKLGHGVRRFSKRFAAWTLALALLALAANAGASLYQRRQIDARRAAREALESTAMSGLRADVEDIKPGSGKSFELSLYLWNVTGGDNLFVMSPEVRAYVQVGTTWQEVPLRPADNTAQQVLRITGRQSFRYIFEPELDQFEELIPGYMHIRFSNAMLVSREAEPKDDLIDRTDNYYVYLKPHNADDQRILKASRFPGKPPVWIPMPPH